MASNATIEEVVRLARQLSALDKLKVIERLAPDLEAALEFNADSVVREAVSLDERYQRGYEEMPEDTAMIEALLPHLPVRSERWE
ncbi:MAG TPA: hypothetical protein VFC78_00965 [Tepidisphaeraceae bacterium]|nr:hypothetical protein [Tepidisphaeraceae bacterium]